MNCKNIFFLIRGLIRGLFFYSAPLVFCLIPRQAIRTIRSHFWIFKKVFRDEFMSKIQSQNCTFSFTFFVDF